MSPPPASSKYQHTNQVPGVGLPTILQHFQQRLWLSFTEKKKEEQQEEPVIEVNYGKNKNNQQEPNNTQRRTRRYSCLQNHNTRLLSSYYHGTVVYERVQYQNTQHLSLLSSEQCAHGATSGCVVSMIELDGNTPIIVCSFFIHHHLYIPHMRNLNASNFPFSSFLLLTILYLSQLFIFFIILKTHGDVTPDHFVLCIPS